MNLLDLIGGLIIGRALEKQDEMQNEIASLNRKILDLNQDGASHNYEGCRDLYDHADNKRKDEVNKYEYTLQESQDRGKLGVAYDAPLKKVKEAYVKLAREHQHNDTQKFTEITETYKRLLKIDNEKKSEDGNP